MPNLNFIEYRKQLNVTDIISAFKLLNRQYDITDSALSKIATSADFSESILKSEIQLLEDKDILIALACDLKCKTVEDISHKIDFLGTVYLEEQNLEDLPPEGLLIKSLWEDGEKFL